MNYIFWEIKKITDGFSDSRLDYEWVSTNEQVIKVSKYSTITITGDGKCSILVTERETGAKGRIDLVVYNNEIIDVFIYQIKK